MAHNLDTLTVDYDSIRTQLINILRDYNLVKDLHKSSTGIMIIELLAYVTELMNFYINDARAEMTLGLAQKRSSLIQLAKSFGYDLFYGAPANGGVFVVFNVDLDVGKDVVIPPYTYLQTKQGVNFITYDNNIWTYADTSGAGSGTINVRQGILRQKDLGVSKGNEFESFQVPTRYVTVPNAYNPALVNVTLEVVTRRQGQTVEDGQLWEFKDTLITSTFDDKHFTVELDEDNYVNVKFGDGIFGSIPDPGSIITVNYEEHVGTFGNVDGADVVSFNVNSLAYYNTYSTDTLLELEQLSAQDFTNGQDPDTNDQLREKTKSWTRLQQRSVSIDDFKTAYSMHYAVVRPQVIGYNTLYSIITDGYTCAVDYGLLSGSFDRPWQFVEVSAGYDAEDVTAASALALENVDIWTMNAYGGGLSHIPDFDKLISLPFDDMSGTASGWTTRLMWTDNRTYASDEQVNGVLSASQVSQLRSFINNYFPPIINLNIYYQIPEFVWTNLSINVEREEGFYGTDQAILDGIKETVWRYFGFEAMDDNEWTTDFGIKLYVGEVEREIMNSVEGVKVAGLAGGPLTGFAMYTIDPSTGSSAAPVTAQPSGVYTSGYGAFWNPDERSIQFKMNQFPIINVSAVNFV